MPTSESFNWLHLTDLHFGQAGQRPLWPNVREAFFQDLHRLHERCGPWQAVLFTGDFVQAGKAEEFKGMEAEVLTRLWKELRALGSSDAVLLAVPGNHDLVRPEKPTATVRQLLRQDGFAEIAEEFWTEHDGEYRQVITTAFANYRSWWTTTHFRPGATVPLQEGLLPGDFAASFPIGSRKLGIVGLNTTFLQLTGGNYTGRLAWDLRQLEAVCGRDVVDWFGEHNACLLLTHQGPEWLDARSGDAYKEINPAGRFAVHLFGHMHETVVRSTSMGGGKPLRQWQDCSLFGLEKYGEPPKTERRHGYGAGRIDFGARGATLRFWPRRATQDATGWRFIPHHESCVLEEDEGTTIEAISSPLPKQPSRRAGNSQPLQSVIGHEDAPT